jgi:hypothetical protein
MPLRTAEDHAAGDVNKDYCQHCSKPDGSLKPYEEVLSGLTAFIKRTQGLDDGVAGATAKKMLSGTRAWAGR